MKELLAVLATGRRLNETEAEQAFAAVMDGEATPAQIAALLMALRVRGETREELAGLVRAMRARVLPVAAPPGTLDLCGTGGDLVGTLNVSTAAAFVVAACGVSVAKHGNRAVSSKSGGSDVLAALGVPEIPVAQLAAVLAATGLVFLFAPNHHPALRHAAAARGELGFRTLFNLAGPLVNPAGVRRQLVGVSDPAWAAPMAELLGRLGAEYVWVVHGQGLDELTLAGGTLVAEWRASVAREFVITPEQAGLGRAPIGAIAGGMPSENAAALLALLEGETGPYRETVLLNAAAALLIAERVADLAEGVRQAATAIDSGAAREKLLALRRYGDN